MTSIEPQPDRDQIEFVRVCKALGEPLRLNVVRLLLAAQGEMRCSDLAERLDVPMSTLSTHLKTLREAGVTTARKDGVVRWSSVRRSDLEQRFPGLLDAAASSAGHLLPG